MAVIRFNCVVNGKRTSTSLSEHLVRHFATALAMVNKQRYPSHYIDCHGKGYSLGHQAAKKVVQDYISDMRNLESTDQIEFKLLQRILYVTPVAQTQQYN